MEDGSVPVLSGSRTAMGDGYSRSRDLSSGRFWLFGCPIYLAWLRRGRGVGNGHTDGAE